MTNVLVKDRNHRLVDILLRWRTGLKHYVIVQITATVAHVVARFFIQFIPHHWLRYKAITEPLSPR